MVDKKTSLLLLFYVSCDAITIQRPPLQKLGYDHQMKVTPALGQIQQPSRPDSAASSFSHDDKTFTETMAFDGRSWFFRDLAADSHVHDVEFKYQRPRQWHGTQNCDIPPPENYKFFSQSSEDMDLYNAFFCGKKGGTFVELGALDGVRFSNTKFFDDFMGWSGVLIEASPKSSELLKHNRQNPNNSIFAEGVCPEGQSSQDFLIGWKPEVSGNPDTMADDFKNRWHNSKIDHVISVPCRSLDLQLEDFIQRSGADHIDFFSLDVEGGELAVLQTFSFKVPVHLWMIEMDGNNKEKDEGVRQLLRNHGYVRSKIEAINDRNEVWVIQSLDKPSK